MYRFIDLFCGIGGFRIALERQGMECVFSSDIDKHAQEQYYRNFGERPEGDITEIPERKIPKHDIMCAGFPCQSFSISGKMQGINDDRGRLFYEIVRIAKYHQPYILLLENVKNIVSIDNGGMIKTIQTKLNEIGYDVYFDILNASYFGVPQARERVYFVCLRKDTGVEYKLNYNVPKQTMKKVYLEDILEKDVNNNLYIDRNDIQLNDNIDVDYNLRTIRIGIVNKGRQGERIYSPKGHSITLSANGGGAGARTGLYLIGDKIRRLSLNECKVVMGFNKNHCVSEGIQGYTQLGNAVIPNMIKYVYDNIKVTI